MRILTNHKYLIASAGMFVLIALGIMTTFFINNSNISPDESNAAILSCQGLDIEFSRVYQDTNLRVWGSESIPIINGNLAYYYRVLNADANTTLKVSGTGWSIQKKANEQLTPTCTLPSNSISYCAGGEGKQTSHTEEWLLTKGGCSITKKLQVLANLDTNSCSNSQILFSKDGSTNWAKDMTLEYDNNKYIKYYYKVIGDPELKLNIVSDGGWRLENKRIGKSPTINNAQIDEGTCRKISSIGLEHLYECSGGGQSINISKWTLVRDGISCNNLASGTLKIIAPEAQGKIDPITYNCNINSLTFSKDSNFANETNNVELSNFSNGQGDLVYYYKVTGDDQVKLEIVGSGFSLPKTSINQAITNTCVKFSQLDKSYIYKCSGRVGPHDSSWTVSRSGCQNIVKNLTVKSPQTTSSANSIQNCDLNMKFTPKTEIATGQAPNVIYANQDQELRAYKNGDINNVSDLKIFQISNKYGTTGYLLSNPFYAAKDPGTNGTKHGEYKYRVESISNPACKMEFTQIIECRDGQIKEGDYCITKTPVIVPPTVSCKLTMSFSSGLILNPLQNQTISAYNNGSTNDVRIVMVSSQYPLPNPPYLPNNPYNANFEPIRGTRPGIYEYRAELISDPTNCKSEVIRQEVKCSVTQEVKNGYCVDKSNQVITTTSAQACNISMTFSSGLNIDQYQDQVITGLNNGSTSNVKITVIKSQYTNGELPSNPYDAKHEANTGTRVGEYQYKAEVVNNPSCNKVYTQYVTCKDPSTQEVKNGYCVEKPKAINPEPLPPLPVVNCNLKVEYDIGDGWTTVSPNLLHTTVPYKIRAIDEMGKLADLYAGPSPYNGFTQVWTKLTYTNDNYYLTSHPSDGILAGKYLVKAKRENCANEKGSTINVTCAPNYVINSNSKCVLGSNQVITTTSAQACNISMTFSSGLNIDQYQDQVITGLNNGSTSNVKITVIKSQYTNGELPSNPYDAKHEANTGTRVGEYQYKAEVVNNPSCNKVYTQYVTCKDPSTQEVKNGYCVEKPKAINPEPLPPLPVVSPALGGSTFMDKDLNGIFGSGDLVVADVLLCLSIDGAKVSETRSDLNGNYSFSINYNISIDMRDRVKVSVCAWDTTKYLSLIPVNPIDQDNYAKDPRNYTFRGINKYGDFAFEAR